MAGPAEPSDVIVTGAPRSGTSLVAGLFVAAGHDPGTHLIPPTASNPAGFFEGLDVNAANDALLDAVADHPVPGTDPPPRSLRWLGAFDRAVPAEAGRGRDLARSVPRSPFVLKDPRFTYTLPAWRPVLGAARVVVVVRHPSEVVASVAAMAAREPETFAGLDPGPDHVLAMWAAVHRAVLSWADEGTCFVRRPDIDTGRGVARLERATGTTLPRAAVRPDLHREHARDPLPAEVATLHAELEARCGAPEG